MKIGLWNKKEKLDGEKLEKQMVIVQSREIRDR